MNTILSALAALALAGGLYFLPKQEKPIATNEQALAAEYRALVDDPPSGMTPAEAAARAGEIDPTGRRFDDDTHFDHTVSPWNSLTPGIGGWYHWAVSGCCQYVSNGTESGWYCSVDNDDVCTLTLSMRVWDQTWTDVYWTSCSGGNIATITMSQWITISQGVHRTTIPGMSATAADDEMARQIEAKAFKAVADSLLAADHKEYLSLKETAPSSAESEQRLLDLTEKFGDVPLQLGEHADTIVPKWTLANQFAWGYCDIEPLGCAYSSVEMKAAAKDDFFRITMILCGMTGPNCKLHVTMKKVNADGSTSYHHDFYTMTCDILNSLAEWNEIDYDLHVNGDAIKS